MHSDLPDDAFFHNILESNFPALLVKEYRTAIHDHPLKREIIATQLANQVVNMAGLTFVHRITLETGSALVDVIRAFVVVAKIYDMEGLFRMVESLDGKITLSHQYEIYHHLRWLFNLATRWFLRKKRLDGALDKIIANYHIAPTAKKQGDGSQFSRINAIKKMISNYIVGDTRNYFESIKQQFLTYGLSAKIAREIALSRVMYKALNIIEVSIENKMDLQKVTEAYLFSDRVFHLVWFRDKIGRDTQEGYWNSLARVSLRDELDTLQRALTVCVLQDSHLQMSTRKCITLWVEQHPSIVARFEQLLKMLLENPNPDYAAFFTVLKILKGMLEFDV